MVASSSEGRWSTSDGAEEPESESDEDSSPEEDGDDDDETEDESTSETSDDTEDESRAPLPGSAPQPQVPPSGPTARAMHDSCAGVCADD